MFKGKVKWFNLQKGEATENNDRVSKLFNLIETGLFIDSLISRRDFRLSGRNKKRESGSIYLEANISSI